MKICCAGKTYWPELKMNLSFTQMCRLKFIFLKLLQNLNGVCIFGGFRFLRCFRGGV